jgi:hypothetical protein
MMKWWFYDGVSKGKQINVGLARAGRSEKSYATNPGIERERREH